MSGDVKVMLLGHVEPARVEAALVSMGFPPSRFGDDGRSTRYSVSNTSGCYLGLLEIYGPAIPFHEGAAVYAGERTVLSGTADLDFVMSDLVVGFGGYYRSAEPGAVFEFVEKRPVEDARSRASAPTP